MMAHIISPEKYYIYVMAFLYFPNIIDKLIFFGQSRHNVSAKQKNTTDPYWIILSEEKTNLLLISTLFNGTDIPTLITLLFWEQNTIEQKQ